MIHVSFFVFFCNDHIFTTANGKQISTTLSIYWPVELFEDLRCVFYYGNPSEVIEMLIATGLGLIISTMCGNPNYVIYEWMMFRRMFQNATFD